MYLKKKEKKKNAEETFDIFIVFIVEILFNRILLLKMVWNVYRKQSQLARCTPNMLSWWDCWRKIVDRDSIVIFLIQMFRYSW